MKSSEHLAPGSAKFRLSQRLGLLRFAAGSRNPRGFGYLDERGTTDPHGDNELYITCRMTHVFSLGLMAGEFSEPGAPTPADLASLAAHGISALQSGPLHDREHGGWVSRVDSRGLPVESSKRAYDHAFVLLAASSAAMADIAGAASLLARATEIQGNHFWDESEGLVLEEWDAGWQTLEPYRGLNSNMHTVEAYLAAGDALGDQTWYERAGRIAERVIAWGAENSWRLPEHFDSTWTPLLNHHRDQPAHPFRPFGATVGHGLEWARLLVSVREALGEKAPDALLDGAIALHRRAVEDGWSSDGAEGFVYTTDWTGEPVVRARMHWVVAEAIATATVLHAVTGEHRYLDEVGRWWDYADRYIIDHQRGSWRHELDERNRPAATTWPGKPDVYHAYQAALIADLPVAPSFAGALSSKRR